MGLICQMGCSAPMNRGSGVRMESIVAWRSAFPRMGILQRVTPVMFRWRPPRLLLQYPASKIGFLFALVEFATPRTTASKGVLTWTLNKF